MDFSITKEKKETNFGAHCDSIKKVFAVEHLCV